MNRVLREIMDRLLASELAIPSRVVGYSEKEIAEIEAALGVKVPHVLREFLQVGGRQLGVFEPLGDSQYDGIVEVNTRARRLSSEWGHPIPESAFVFFYHQDYQFAFSLCDGADDPEVFFMLEGEPSVSLEMPFTEWLGRELDVELERDESRPSWWRRERWKPG